MFCAFFANNSLQGHSLILREENKTCYPSTATGATASPSTVPRASQHVNQLWVEVRVFRQTVEDKMLRTADLEAPKEVHAGGVQHQLRLLVPMKEPRATSTDLGFSTILRDVAARRLFVQHLVSNLHKIEI